MNAWARITTVASNKNNIPKAFFMHFNLNTITYPTANIYKYAYIFLFQITINLFLILNPQNPDNGIDVSHNKLNNHRSLVGVQFQKQIGKCRPGRFHMNKCFQLFLSERFPWHLNPLQDVTSSAEVSTI